MPRIATKHAAAAVLLLLALAGWACETPTMPSGLQLDVAVEARGGVKASASSLELLRAAETDEPIELSGWIGPDGGSLQAGRYRLTVERNGVSNLTLFVVRILDTGYIEADLRAYEMELLGLTLVESFEKPVRLDVEYGGSPNLVDPSRVTVVHVPGDSGGYQNMEPVPSRVDLESGTVGAGLSHFSRYCLAEGY